MADSQPARPNPQTLAELLIERKIHKVAIIDDAFDRRSREELSAHELEDFWADLEFNNTPAMDELVELGNKINGVQITDSQDISDEILQALWNQREDLNALSQPVKT